MGDLWSARFFFSSNLVGRIFFYSSVRIFSIAFVLHAVFSSDKRLQEIFFPNHPPPPPPQELNGWPLRTHCDVDRDLSLKTDRKRT